MTTIHHDWIISISLKGQNKAVKPSLISHKAITGFWQPSTDNYSPLISDYITTLLTQLSEDPNLSNDTNSLQDAFIDIRVTIPSQDADQGGCEFDLDPNVLAKLAKTGLPMRVTVDCTEIGL